MFEIIFIMLNKYVKRVIALSMHLALLHSGRKMKIK
jgi:hypothetical protein